MAVIAVTGISAIAAPEQFVEALKAATDLVCNGCVQSTDIQDGEVKTADLGVDAVTTNKIENQTIVADDVAHQEFIKAITLLDGANGGIPTV